MNTAQKITLGQTSLGIEFGSTRIKAVLIDDCFAPIAAGVWDWENRHENGYWTYSLEQIHDGLQGCYTSLAADVKEKYGVEITTIGSIGISGMMHGYMPFDAKGNLLAPFRTWRNTTTAAAADELTKLFRFNIPQRWSIAHLYQAILNSESHVPQIAYITTLAEYVHFLLTGRKIVGVGEASGMFPVSDGYYDKTMTEKFERAAAEKGFTQKLSDILPQVAAAGESCGTLTEVGAALLDVTGRLKAGIPLCAPEGDAGTGMTATNSVKPKTGNISAGTSAFAMFVMDKKPQKLYPQVDMVCTPDGADVAMVHCNNCCSELDAWVGVFGEFAALLGVDADKGDLYGKLYRLAMTAPADCGGVTAYNLLAGEPVVDVETGCPMYFRGADSKLSLANFMRAQLCAAAASLKYGMDILFEGEGISAARFCGHGGLFKTKNTASQIFADALHTPVAVMKTAGEGGAWGMALLAAFMNAGEGKALAEWLEASVFAGQEVTVSFPDKKGEEGFAKYMENYIAGLHAERALNK